MGPDDYKYLFELEEDFWWFEGMRATTASFLGSFLPAGIDRLILDAGCGTGQNLNWLEQYAGQGAVTGLDLSSIALAYSRMRGHEKLVLGSSEKLPFEASTFDFVTSFDVVGQLPDQQACLRAIQEMYRIIKPGGLCFLRVAAYSWLHSSHDEALGTARRYSRSSLSRLFRNAGFRILRKSYLNMLLFPVAASRRLILKPLKLSPEGSDVKPLSPFMRALNPALKAALLSESRLISWGINLPFGLSVVCLARKP